MVMKPASDVMFRSLGAFTGESEIWKQPRNSLETAFESVETTVFMPSLFTLKFVVQAYLLRWFSHNTPTYTH